MGIDAKLQRRGILLSLKFMAKDFHFGKRNEYVKAKTHTHKELFPSKKPQVTRVKTTKEIPTIWIARSYLFFLMGAAGV